MTLKLYTKNWDGYERIYKEFEDSQLREAIEFGANIASHGNFWYNTEVLIVQDEPENRVVTIHKHAAELLKANNGDVA